MLDLHRGGQNGRLESAELVSAVHKTRRILFHVGGFTFFTNLLMLTGPMYMLQVYDRVLASQSVPTLTALTLLILILFASLGVIEWVRAALFEHAASRFEQLLSDRALQASRFASLADAGRQTDKPLRDLRLIRRFLSGPALSAAFDTPWTPLFFAVLFLLHPAFGICALAGAAVLVGLGLLNQKLSSSLFSQAEALERDAAQRASELMRGAEVIRALGMDDTLQQKWREQFEASDRAMSNASRMLSRFTQGTKAFRLFLQSAILGLGALLAIQQEISPGAMIAASILMGRAIAPVEQIVAQWRSIVSTREAWRSLERVLDASPPPRERMSLPSITGRLVVENLVAGPAGSRAPTLRSIQFRAEPGDVVGIIGPSGSGKSTLARILVGIWPATSGEIRIDGAALNQYAAVELGAQIGYLPQHVDLMSGSVRANISRFNLTASPDQVVSAARLAGCHELILGLIDGYDTEIGAGGAYLSAGQRQRIGLARALFGGPKLIVLDEPSSNLDAAGEDALQAALKELKARGVTALMIGHRPSSLAQCNKLLVLDAGIMRAFGAREEVLRQIVPGPTGSAVHTTRNGAAI